MLALLPWAIALTHRQQAKRRGIRFFMRRIITLVCGSSCRIIASGVLVLLCASLRLGVFASLREITLRTTVSGKGARPQRKIRKVGHQFCCEAFRRRSEERRV